MSDYQLVKDAFQKSGIATIAILDDVFDPPALEAEDVMKLYDVLDDKAYAAGLPESLNALVDDFRGAVADGKTASAAIDAFVAALFDAYLNDRDEKLNPAGVFTRVKGENLSSVWPLVKFLRSLGPGIGVVTAGSRSGEADDKVANADVIFSDYYLDPSVDARVEGDAAVMESARTKARDRINELLQTGTHSPAVILMSSHSRVVEEATQFRQSLAENFGAVIASRFGVLEKLNVSESASDEIYFAPGAADEVVGIAQTYRFGQAMSAALRAWQKALEQARKNMFEQIQDLDLKDLAYLIRFRLRNEGQRIGEYLDWLFGEALREELSQAFDDDESRQAFEDALHSNADHVRSALVGQTNRVADLYHKVRIEAPRKARNGDIRMGDLYADGDAVLAVVTPECDLIVRPLENKRSAHRLMMVAGKLKPINSTSPASADLFFKDGVGQNIVWKYKDVRTMEFDIPRGQLLGTLKPVYALHARQALFNDLGRIGTFVPPPLTRAGKIRVRYRNAEDRSLELALADDVRSDCCIISTRGSQDKKVIVLGRRFMQRDRKSVV